MKIFVYGTLDGNSVLQGNYICKAKTAKKYYRGETNFYPFLVHPNYTKNISSELNFSYQKGKIYDVPDNCIKYIDEYEGHPTLFKRESIDVIVKGCTQQVQCYLYLKSPEDD